MRQAGYRSARENHGTNSEARQGSACSAPEQRDKVLQTNRTDKLILCEIP